MALERCQESHLKTKRQLKKVKEHYEKKNKWRRKKKEGRKEKEGRNEGMRGGRRKLWRRSRDDVNTVYKSLPLGPSRGIDINKANEKRKTDKCLLRVRT